jgi:hypothetical protein
MVVMSVRWKKWGDGEVEDGRAMVTPRYNLQSKLL